MSGSKQIRLGALLSYFAIAFNMIAGLIYTPWMISEIGTSNYGLYTLATSLISMFVMDFGMSAAVSRFVSKYKAEGNQEAINNFLGIVYKLYIAIDGIILIILLVVSFYIKSIYSNLTTSELEIFKVLYVIVGIFSVVSFPFTNLNGILTAHEKFIETKLAGLFHKVFIVVFMVIALMLGYGVFTLVTVNAVSGLLTIAIKLVIIRRKTRVRVNLKYRDKSMLKEIFGFSAWTTISNIAHRMIFNVSPSIVAAVSSTGAVGVAIFGMASTIEGYVYTFATALNGMFMPRISRIIHTGKKDTELMDLMIRIGRIQCMIIGLLLTGFISFGKSFIIYIWDKPEFVESYLCAVFLILPSFFYLSMQIANTTIIVENKVKLIAFVQISAGVINIVLSLILSRFFGALGASISIFAAYSVRNLLLMIIYNKILKLDIKRFFKNTYVKIMPGLAIALVFGLIAERFNPITSEALRFVVNGVAFVVVFAFLMNSFFMNKSEKELIKGVFGQMINKFKPKKNNVI